MTKEVDENSESFPKFWICDNTFVKDDVKIGDHCYVIRK